MSKEILVQYASADGSVIRGQTRDVLFAEGTAKPTDGTAFYAPGCIFLVRGAALGSQFYVNEGSNTSCLFHAISLNGVDLSALTATAVELNKNAGVVAGTGAVSKTLVLGASATSVPTIITTSGGLVNRSATATAIVTTRALTTADSGGVFTVSQVAAYTVTVATPTGAGEKYIFQCVAPGANDVSIVATGCTFEGTITIDASTIPATGSTLKFASSAAILGDNIELLSTSTTKFLVRAIGSGAGGITIS